MKGTLLILILVILASQPSFAQNETLKVLTINIWSGLNYKGIFKMHEYESKARRELRFCSLLAQIRAKSPDIIFLQEVNPADEYTQRLADSLGYDEIHKVCNAGIKLGYFGIPSNLKEGNAILARKNLNLEKIDTWKHSGSLGINSDFINIHFDESIYSLVGKMNVHGKPVYLINVHLFSVMPEDTMLMVCLDNLYKDKIISNDELNDAYYDWRQGIQRQQNEMEDLLRRIKELPNDIPKIVGGDFNSAINSLLINTFENSGNFINTLPYGNHQNKYSWDLERNLNALYEEKYDRSIRESFDIYDSLSSLYDTKKHTIDHIFLDNHFKPADIISSEVVMDSVLYGVHPSDHFGVLTEIRINSY